MLALSSLISPVSSAMRRARSRSVKAAALAGSPLGSAGLSPAHRRNRAGFPSPVIDSRRAGSAQIRTALSWLIAWPRDLMAEALDEWSIRGPKGADPVHRQ